MTAVTAVTIGRNRYPRNDKSEACDNSCNNKTVASEKLARGENDKHARDDSDSVTSDASDNHSRSVDSNVHTHHDK